MICKKMWLCPIGMTKAEKNELTEVWIDMEIAMGFKIGGRPCSWGGSSAMHCRSEAAMSNGSGGTAFMKKTGLAMSTIASKIFLASMQTSQNRRRKGSGRTSEV